MFGQDDGQEEYIVQQKVSYRMYEQEQKVLLRSRYPFLSPVQISRKVRDSWNRLKQDAKQCYTKSVLVKTPTKDMTKVTPKSKPKKQKVRGRLSATVGEICDLMPYEIDSMDSPNQRSFLTSPGDGTLQKDDSEYRSDFYSPATMSPHTNTDSRHDTFCPKLFESPNLESPPHHKFDMFSQKNYTKSKLPIKVPKIIQDEHSTQGILKGSRTDDTPKTKAVKGRVSFSTDRNENIQRSQDCDDDDDDDDDEDDVSNHNQDDDSEDEYNAMLIRRADEDYNFDDIDQHNMCVEEEDRQVSIEELRANLDKRQRKRVSKKKDGSQEREQLQRESLKETAQEKKILKPTNLGNITRGNKRKGMAGAHSDKPDEPQILQVNHGGEEKSLSDKSKERKRQSRNVIRQDLSDVKGDDQSYYSLHEDNPSNDNGHDNSQSNDSANGNSQSNDSANGNSRSNYSANGSSQSNYSANGSSQSNDSSNYNSQSSHIASDNSQSRISSAQDIKSPIQESRKTRSSLRTKHKTKDTEVGSLSVTKRKLISGLKPCSRTITRTTRDYDLTPVQRGETTYITPQMDEDVHTHTLREASKIPRKARRSSHWEEDFCTKLSDNNYDGPSKQTKEKRRSSRRLNGDENAYTEVKESQDASDEFMKCGRKDENMSLLVDASGDAKVSGGPLDHRRSLRSQTQTVIKPDKCDDQSAEDDNDEVITKLSILSNYDSWTIMDEEYISEVLVSEDEHESNPVCQSDASKALVQALRKMKQAMADEDERSSPKLLSPALSGISQMSGVSSESSVTNDQSTSGTGHTTQGFVSTDKAVTLGLCEMFGDMTPPDKRTSRHTRRLLASSSRESGSNFAQLFKTQNIFC